MNRQWIDSEQAVDRQWIDSGQAVGKQWTGSGHTVGIQWGGAPCPCPCSCPCPCTPCTDCVSARADKCCPLHTPCTDCGLARVVAQVAQPPFAANAPHPLCCVPPLCPHTSRYTAHYAHSAPFAGAAFNACFGLAAAWLRLGCWVSPQLLGSCWISLWAFALLVLAAPIEPREKNSQTWLERALVLDRN